MIVRIYEGEIHQGRLAAVVKELFFSENVQQNVRKDVGIKNPFTGSYLELDLWLSDLDICFEFQDNYHYVHTWYSHAPLDITQQKDASKQEIIQSRGITLVLVPCWWDGSKESLSATINFLRPDLLQDRDPEAIATSLNPPMDLTVAKHIPDVGELMLASFPGVNQLDFDTPWWVGEKYDGIRFCWHPDENEIFSRYGLKLDVDESFYDHFSYAFYDGELWFGRGCFPDCQKVINVPANVDWSTMRAVTFDNADLPSRALPFEERYACLLRTIDIEHPFSVVAPRIFCSTSSQITTWLQFVIDDGGEGLIARAPKSFYEPGRSALLYKLKASRGDKEALVVSAENGIIQLQMPDGITFEVHKPHMKLKMGDIVTFTYDRYSRYEIPINPVIQRVRSDVSWEDIQRDSEENLPQTQVLNDYTNKLFNFSQKPAGFWKSEKKNNSRAFFEAFAKTNQFDPLIAENWYSMCSEFYATKGARSVLYHHKYSYTQALLDVFPDIGLVTSRFSTLPRNYWTSVGNRLACFNSFAEKMGFDPLDPENWYFATFLDVLSEYKGTISVMTIYGGFGETLQHLYPNVSFDARKIKVKRFYLRDIDHRRQQFLDFAKVKNMDPLVPNDWYSITHEDLLPFKGIVSMLVHYRGSFVNALVFLFPEISFDRSKFKVLSDTYWHDKKRQKKVFERFAEAKGKNLKDPIFWRDINYDELLTVHGAWPVLKKYRGDVEEALVTLFPNLNLAKATLGLQEISTKEFFTSFARDYGFDPLVAENWHPLTPIMLNERKGSKTLLAKYGGRVWSALSDAFPTIHVDLEDFDLSPSEHWSQLENRRKFFLEFAKRKGFDPQIAKNWYPISRNDIIGEKNAGLVLLHSGGSFLKALLEVFPNIGLDSSKFIFVNRGYWLDKKNRKKFFDELATEHKFDPLDPEKWYSFPFTSLTSSKNPLTSFYNGSFRKALADIYPSVHFDATRFAALQRGHWDSKSNRKRFFDEFAAENNFSPLVPENWYKVSSKKIWVKKSAASVIQHYGGSLMNALMDLYPNIGLKEEKFHAFLASYWIKTKTRRKFFDDFAKENNFDPLIPENWYKVQLRVFYTKKHAGSVLRYYKGSLKKALLHVYPDIGFNPNRFFYARNITHKAT